MNSQVTKKRCDNCNTTFKKSTIINECKCQKFFCLKCSPYYMHTCSFNWLKDKKENLIESNPRINFQKIENI